MGKDIELYIPIWDQLTHEGPDPEDKPSLNDSRLLERHSGWLTHPTLGRFWICISKCKTSFPPHRKKPWEILVQPENRSIDPLSTRGKDQTDVMEQIFEYLNSLRFWYTYA